MTLRTLNYGNYGIFLIMGNAGFCPSTESQHWPSTQENPNLCPYTLNPRLRNPKPHWRSLDAYQVSSDLWLGFGVPYFFLIPFFLKEPLWNTSLYFFTFFLKEPLWNRSLYVFLAGYLKAQLKRFISQVFSESWCRFFSRCYPAVIGLIWVVVKVKVPFWVP